MRDFEPDTPALATRRVNPSFPDGDYPIGSELRCTTLVLINQDGKVVGSERQEGDGSCTDAAFQEACDAVADWVFRPASSGGRPTSSVQELTFKFVKSAPTFRVDD